MSHPNAIEAPASAEEPLLHVSRTQFLGSLAVAVSLFLFARGPMWKHAGDISRLDGAVWWSYGAVPLLIAGCLVASRRWSVRAFMLDTMALTLVKYVLTFGLAVVFWATISPPLPAAAMPPPRPVPALHEQAIAPTPIDPLETGAVRVTVVDPAGRPLAGALVFVAAGLEDYVFAPPAEPAIIQHGPLGMAPALAVAQAGQKIEAQSTDGRMHTLVAARAEEVLFNVPLLASGAPTSTVLREARGLTTLRCNVHPEEPEGRLLTVANPYFGWSDAEGRVLLSDVPGGKLRVGVVYGEHGAGEAAVELHARESAEVRIEVARRAP